MPTLPHNPRRPLQRNLRRRRIAGVCAGIADWLGVSPTAVRAVFVLSVFVSFSLTFWIYLVLWVLLPASSDLPLPEVSWALGRELRRIERRVRQAHRRLDPALADQVQATFDAVKILAPSLDRGGVLPDEAALREAALLRFPKLVDRLLGLPAGFVAPRVQHPPGVQADFAELLLTELEDLGTQLTAVAGNLMERELKASFGGRAETSAELAAWKERLDPLQSRLRERSGSATLDTLRQIEEKLAFLLERIDEGNDPFDLKSFEVRKIAFDYLPDALDQYLQLPPMLAQSQRLASGKTAEEALHEQLNLLDNALLELAKSLFENDARGLLVHGRFLREKFAEQPFRLAE
jgi:phage shock protein PspC (stress-responsive transcriptional regulator)